MGRQIGFNTFLKIQNVAFPIVHHFLSFPQKCKQLKFKISLTWKRYSAGWWKGRMMLYQPVDSLFFFLFFFFSVLFCFRFHLQRIIPCHLDFSYNKGNLSLVSRSFLPKETSGGSITGNIFLCNLKSM